MKTQMPGLKFPALALAALLLLAGGAQVFSVRAADVPAPAAAASAAAAKPALTVTLTQPQRAALALTLAANGSIAAWQEALIGAESNGWRLDQVLVNVGDAVRRGQVLASFTVDLAQAELAQGRAAVAEAEATLAEAAANAQRARELQASGALSAQQINQFLTAERTAQARLDALRAAAQVQQLRLAQARVLAPDDGVISSRSATVGAVVPVGTELFRLIRRGRLEWRAEVAASELAQLRPGQAVRVLPAGGPAVAGKVRMVAPTVDAATRNGIVYVDLPAPGQARAGMFARGEFDLGSASALTLPQTAVLQRDGFSYVFTLGPGNQVRQTKVGVGRRAGERIEITGGLDPEARVVASGGGFLADGDTVRVVDAPPPVKTASR
ncbi:RND transporter [Rubrivivax sp. A210]|uniref:efflux RND transporter periplasmic adaptor subunit n=1 Tax=Rubrivivax sp. A210 TaxID=2772301 RepID=UPI0019CDEDF8|nr:efflux RND transporter periplasmic adaptor subunit [Rubrivivax sp. A210]CAD5372689.1 RND transporter [Rubrivivax sp. A210]